MLSDVFDGVVVRTVRTVDISLGSSVVIDHLISNAGVLVRFPDKPKIFSSPILQYIVFVKPIFTHWF